MQEETERIQKNPMKASVDWIPNARMALGQGIHCSAEHSYSWNKGLAVYSEHLDQLNNYKKKIEQCCIKNNTYYSTYFCSTHISYFRLPIKTYRFLSNNACETMDGPGVTNMTTCLSLQSHLGTNIHTFFEKFYSNIQSE